MNSCQYLSSVIMVVVLSVVIGCRTEFKTIELRSRPGATAEDTDDEEQQEGDIGWDDLEANISGNEKTRPRFIARGDAREAPSLSLESFNGRQRDITPAREGRVTVMIFWSLDSLANKAALMHINQLVNQYRRHGLRGINVVEKPPTQSHRDAPRFLDRHNINMPTYYDDFTALRRMAKAAGIDIKWQVPVIYIIDQDGRVRFSKLGFSHSGSVKQGLTGSQPRLSENAPEGSRIEDYIRRLLKNE